MPDYPIVLLRREPKNGARIPGNGRYIPPRANSVEQQKARLGAVFERIARRLEDASLDIAVAADPAAIAPDRVLVLEARVALADLADAAKKLGFEWLGELAPSEEEEADEEATAETADADEVGDRLFVALPTERTLRDLLSLWRSYSAGEPPGGRKAWWTLFGYLADLRVWSPKDRVEVQTVSYLRERMEAAPGEPVRLELDLWFRGTDEARASAVAEVRALVEGMGGAVLDIVTIPPIEYLALLADVPPARAAELAERGGPLAGAGAVMSVRPQSLFQAPLEDATSLETAESGVPGGIDGRPAIAALIDGHVVGGHDLLAGRVDVIEADIPGDLAPANTRRHGTAMASLILHDDLAAGGQPLGRRLAVVPILSLGPGGQCETTPLDRLPLGLVYRAVLRLVEGIDGAGPAGPGVVILNHSVCDEGAPTTGRRPSPWARLLDYLSHRYNLLFVVSAGNRAVVVPMPEYKNWEAFRDADPIHRQIAIIRAVETHKERRRLLSPAEGINVLTVGALHADEAGPCPEPNIDPYLLSGLTNLCSAVGPGVNGCLKPELVQPGGRQVVAFSPLGNHIGISGRQISHLGQVAAAPGDFGRLNRTVRSTGTSNAAALTTRAGIQIAGAVEEAFAAQGTDWLGLPTRAVVLKALLAHGCSWGEIGDILDEAYPPMARRHWHARRKTIARFLGYGRPDADAVTAGATNRITLLGQDQIATEELHEYRLPLPEALLRSRELRRLTLTLAWSSPIFPGSLAYRGTKLQLVDRYGRRSFWEHVKSRLQPNANGASGQQKGTLIHFVLEGESLIRSVPENGIFIGVQSVPVRGVPSTTAPYALALSLEVATTLRLNIYYSIRSAIASRVGARARART